MSYDLMVFEKTKASVTALTLLEQFQSPQQLLLTDRCVVFDLILKLSRSGKNYAKHDYTFNIESSA